MKYLCCIVEDEKQGANVLLTHIQKSPDLVCVSTELDSEIALRKLETGELKVDLIFLDMDMDKINGLDFGGIVKAKKLGEIIYVTAHEKYAAKSYELEAVDYIVKPATMFRFRIAIEKFKARLAGNKGAIIKMAPLFFIYTDKNSKITKIAKDDLACVEVKGDTLIFHLTTGRQTVTATLKEFEMAMGDFPFMKFHRSFIGNIEKVISIDQQFVHFALPNTQKFSLGRNFKNEFRERVMYYLGFEKGKIKNNG